MTTPDTAVPRLVVVDDTDPSIQYTPSTAFSKDSAGKLDGQGYGGPVFNHTLTGLSGTSNNGSLTFSFNGTRSHISLLTCGYLPRSSQEPSFVRW